MAQDFYIDPAKHDWDLVGGTTIRLCESFEELIRQRLEINLKVFLTEWFANVNYGVPYFQSVYGKNVEKDVDPIFRSAIRNTEGVIKINSFRSSLDRKTRKYSLVFSVFTEQGEIPNIEVVLDGSIT